MCTLTKLSLVLLMASCCLAGWSAWGPCRNGWQSRTMKVGRRTYTSSRTCSSSSGSSGNSGNTGSGSVPSTGEWGPWGACVNGERRRARKQGRYTYYGIKKCINFTPSGGSPQNAAEQSCLDEHNKLRALHNKKPLKWDRNLAASALNWAKVCAYTYRDIVHTPKNQRKYGENLAYSSDKRSPQGGEAVTRWYKEICDYKQCSFSGETGHFTQVIWGESEYLGCAVINAPSGVYTVGQYHPGGNMAGEFCNQVGEPYAAIMNSQRSKLCY